MKNTVLFAITLLILASCARITPASKSTSLEKTSAPNVGAKANEGGKTRAIFHIVDPLGVHLVLVNVESRAEEIVLMDKNLSLLYLRPGSWQVAGFVLNGKRYKTMNTSKQFIFDLQKDKVTYVGTYIFQCPKVNGNYLKQMKKMNFFNRYPFSNETGLCEVVVGSDFKNVKRVWKKVDAQNKRPLELGF
jgi:hypothetical protein